MAKYYWEGGLRLVDGSAKAPAMQARCLGGSTVVNSAIMFALPDWVREIWNQQTGAGYFTDPSFDASFARVFERTRTQPTPLAVMGRRNLRVRDALAKMGEGASKPLPRAVEGCQGCADCMTGCACGAKQSVDRSYLPDALRHGATVYTCSQVDRVLMQGSKAVGVGGRVVDIDGWRDVGNFKVRARKYVILAAGVMATPVILRRSNVNPNGAVGKTLECHLTGGVFAAMDEVVDPWHGATQGWGAISTITRGMKYESLWAPASVLAVRFGDLGAPFYEQMQDIKHVTVIALVYRGNTRGTVKPKRDGLPKMRLKITEADTRVVQQGLKRAADAFLDIGARYAYCGLPGTKSEMRSKVDTEAMLSPKIKAKHMSMTFNHAFCSAPMSSDPRRGVVGVDGRVHATEGLYVADTSIFPSATAVNPQATCMALSDRISRQLGELALT